MLRWRGLHPYNAVHVIRVPHQLDAARLQDHIRDVLEQCGLTRIELDPRRRRYEYRGGVSNAALQVLAGHADPERVLAAEIERQLNARFPEEGIVIPFRFFAVDTGGGFFLGLVYDHYIAGGDAIVPLLNDVHDRYLHTTSGQAAQESPRLYPATYRNLMLRRPLQALRAIAGTLSLLARSRRIFRPRYAPDDDARIAFVYSRIGPAQLDGLLRVAKGWQVTFHDLLVAILLLALSPLATDRRQARSRRELAVASIANIRQDFESGGADGFGQFLASFSIAHPVPAGVGLKQLVLDVHAQTTRIKQHKLYLQSILALSLAGLVWPLLSKERRYRFFPKHFPVWGGITTLNVNQLWRLSAAGERPPEYRRAVPTGPLCPLVLAATTAGDVLHLGISYRVAAFSPEQVASVVATFVDGIDRLGPEVA